MSKIKKQERTPSQIKYDEEHPTVSFRIDQKLYDQLITVKEKEGKTTVDVLKVGLSILTVKAKDENAIREAAYEQGYADGFVEAEDLFKITFQCPGCKEKIDVTDESMKKDIERYLKEVGWGHEACVGR